MLIELTQDLAERLLETADVYGLDGAEDGDRIRSAIEFLLELDSQLDQLPQGSLEAEGIANAVDAIVNFNASIPLVIEPGNIVVEPAEQRLDFTDLENCVPDDPLVVQAKDLSELERNSLAFLYTHLPTDLWGTEQAATMWKRQVYFDASKGS